LKGTLACVLGSVIGDVLFVVACLFFIVSRMGVIF
jgi:hypothetical protein